MTNPLHGTVSGRGLGGELRALREGRGLTLRGVSTQLGWPASKLSRMETGKLGIRVPDVASLLVVYGVTGAERDRLLAMAQRSDEPGWLEVTRGLPKEDRTLIHLESEATRIFSFQPLVVPGLLQTPDYIRATMQASGISENDAEQRVAVRLARQAILTRRTPPVLEVILDEMVLRRVLGSRRVMARQLRRLVEAAGEPNVTLRVIPFEVGGHAGLDGAMVILDFTRHHSVAYLEHRISGVFLEHPDEVAIFRREAEQLEAVALGAVESQDLVAQVAAEHAESDAR